MTIQQTEKLLEGIVDEMNEAELLLLIAMSTSKLANLLGDKKYLLGYINLSAESMLKVATHLKRANQV